MRFSNTDKYIIGYNFFSEKFEMFKMNKDECFDAKSRKLLFIIGFDLINDRTKTDD